MPVFQETRNTVRQAVGRTTGLLLGTFAVTTATLAQLTAAGLRIKNAGQGADLWLYVYTGGGSGQARLTHSAAVPGSPGDSAILYLAPVFTTAPSTNASFEAWERVYPPDVNSFIDDAIRAVARRILGHKEDMGIQLDDRLGRWGSFEDWPDGASAAPNGWTLNGAGAAVARESTIKYSGRYSAKVTNADATAAYLESGNIPEFPKFADASCTVKAKVYTTTASRVRLALLDGVNTWYSNYHDGLNGWNGDDGVTLAVDDKTLSKALTQLKVQLRTETGAAISVYWGKVWVKVGGHIYEYELPQSNATDTAFAYLSEVWMEHDQDGVYNIKVPVTWYEIDATATPKKLVLIRDKVESILVAGRQLKLVGQSHPRLPTADTDNLEVDPEYVRKQASILLTDALGWNEMERSKRDRWQREVEQYLAGITTFPYPDAYPVEVW